MIVFFAVLAVLALIGLWMKKKIGRFCQVATKLSTKNTK